LTGFTLNIVYGCLINSRL